MRVAAFILALAGTACSASGKPIFATDASASPAQQPQAAEEETEGKPAKPADAGKPPSEMEIKNLSFTGTTAEGQFTFVLTNGSTKQIETVTEVRVTVASGELVFPTRCKRLLSDDELFVMPGMTSKVIHMNVEALYEPASAMTTIECQDTSQMLGNTTRIAAGRDETPLALTIKGIYADAAKWTAKGTVE